MLYLETIPAIVCALIVFGIILFDIRLKFSLGTAFAGGALGMGLLFGMLPVAIVKSMGASLFHPKTISLAIVVCLILLICGNIYFLILHALPV